MESTPHLVLFSRTGEQPTQHGLHGGSWYFRLETMSGELKLEASDVELNASQERLELLSVVRGLEALDQPSLVTLVTSSRQVSRAVRQGLEYWRNRDWKWERFGEKVPMKNADLWKRVDGALRIHDVRCRTLRFDPHHSHSYEQRTDERRVSGQVVPKPKFAKLQSSLGRTAENVGSKPHQSSFVLRPLIWLVRGIAEMLQAVSNALQRYLPETANPRLT